MVVDFPAPFFPRNPTTSPFETSNETALTAAPESKHFVKESTRSIGKEILSRHQDSLTVFVGNDQFGCR
jgi:hypothetical protein